MSADGARERLEARVHQMLTDTRQEGIADAAAYLGTRLNIPHLAKHLTGRMSRRRGYALAILAAADAYADARAAEAIDGHINEQARAARARDRRDKLADEINGAPR